MWCRCGELSVAEMGSMSHLQELTSLRSSVFGLMHIPNRAPETRLRQQRKPPRLRCVETHAVPLQELSEYPCCLLFPVVFSRLRHAPRPNLLFLPPLPLFLNTGRVRTGIRKFILQRLHTLLGMSKLFQFRSISAFCRRIQFLELIPIFQEPRFRLSVTIE